MAPPQLNELNDGALVARVAEGDTLAFEEIYDRYRAQAFGLALRVTRRPATAEEVTQDAFMSLWRAARNFDSSRGSLSTWLLSVVRYRGIDALRSGARAERNVGLDDPAAERLEVAGRTEALVEDRETALDTRRVLTGLPDEQRKVVELAYFAGLTQAEIAAKTGIPLGTVKGRMRLALDKLRPLLGTEPQLARTA